jgi:hypothetical protein
VTTRIPPEQYLRAMQQLAVTFTGRPVLSDQLGLRLPLSAEAGFSWSWVAADAGPTVLTPRAAPHVPSYGYSPQQLLERWLDLIPDPLSTNRSQQ